MNLAQINGNCSNLIIQLLRNVKQVYTKKAIFRKIYTLYIYSREIIKEAQMTANSLRQYNKSALTNLGSPSNNFNRPNLDPNNGGLLQATNVGTVLNGTNKFNMNYPYTSDSILSGMGNTSTNIKGQGFIEGFTKVLTVLTGVGTLAMTGFGVAQGVKAMKQQVKSGSNQGEAAPADQNLSSLTQTADSYDKKSDKTAMGNTAESLISAIKTAKDKESEAKRRFAETETSITNLDKDKTKFVGQLNDLKSQKTDLTTNLNKYKYSLSTLEAIPEEQRTPEQKTQIEQLKTIVDKEEKAIKANEEKQKTIENQIIRIAREMEELNTRKAQYKQQMETLPGEIKDAEKALEKLNKRINK